MFIYWIGKVEFLQRSYYNYTLRLNNVDIRTKCNSISTTGFVVNPIFELYKDDRGYDYLSLSKQVGIQFTGGRFAIDGEITQGAITYIKIMGMAYIG